MAQVLVTGGAGFIGSHLTEALLEKGYAVTVLDNLDPYYDVAIKQRNLDLIRRRGAFTHVNGSVCDLSVVEKLVSGDTEAIFHEAAQPGVRISVEDPAKPNAVNATGTLNLLNACRSRDVGVFVNASSSSVYGKVETLPFTEDHPKTPISPYGASKLVAEHYCRVAADIYGINTVSLRYFTVYGPRMRPDLAIPIFTRALLAGKAPTFFGDGHQSRDMTFIDDIVAGNLTLLGKRGLGGAAYNIGSGRNQTLRQAYDLLQEILGTRIEPVIAPTAKGDAEHTWADVARARKALGYEPRTELRQGLTRFAEWFRDNPGFYEGGASAGAGT